MASMDSLRAAFPTLEGPTVYLDNAGGSQCPSVVADRVRSYMLTSFVQLGADYEMSRVSTQTVDDAHDFVRLLVNAPESKEPQSHRVVLGPSTSQLLMNLSLALPPPENGRDELLVYDGGHEANVAPWVRLADSGGYRLVWWHASAEQYRLTADVVSPLLTSRTALVCFPHVSNLLGVVNDVPGIVTACHAAGAKVVVDAVAYAPHRSIDVAAWGVDFYVFSLYKVYGPHMAALYGKSFESLRGLNFFFIPSTEVPYKYELGGVPHELCAGALGIGDYLNHVVGRDREAPLKRETITAAFDRMTSLETPLVVRLLEWMASREQLRVIGLTSADPSVRVGTISFVHSTRSSQDIAIAANKQGYGIRWGHFYSQRLCTQLGIDPGVGVVRISIVHYNTMQEIDALLAVLDKCI